MSPAGSRLRDSACRKNLFAPLTKFWNSEIVSKTIDFNGEGNPFWGFPHTPLYWVAAALSGSLMLEFSEVIRLLHEINQKTK